MSDERLFHFRDLVIWAQDGAVIVQCDRTGLTSIVPRRDFLDRLRALGEANRREHRPDAREEVQSMIERGILVAKAAQRQGDQLDPKVIEARIRARKRNFLFTGGS